MTDLRPMRAADSEREATAEILRRAYTAGRLDGDELRERAGRAYAARTWGELNDLTADLPALPGPVFSPGPEWAPRMTRWPPGWVRWLAPALAGALLTVTVTVTGNAGAVAFLVVWLVVRLAVAPRSRARGW